MSSLLASGIANGPTALVARPASPRKKMDGLFVFHFFCVFFFMAYVSPALGAGQPAPAKMDSACVCFIVPRLLFSPHGRIESAASQPPDGARCDRIPSGLKNCEWHTSTATQPTSPREDGRCSLRQNLLWSGELPMAHHWISPGRNGGVLTLHHVLWSEELPTAHQD